MKRFGLILAGFVMLALVGAGIGGYALWRRGQPLREVRIVVERPATAHENEVGVLEPIEHAVARTDRTKRITGEATPNGVTVSVFFADVSDTTLEHVRANLKSAAKQLPPGLAPPVANVVPPTESYFLRAKEPAALAMPGVFELETCGRPLPERTVVRLDPNRMASYGIDLLEIKTALEARHPFERGPAVDPTELGMQLLRGSPAALALRDVATVTTAARRPDCDVFSLDGGPTVYEIAAVQKEHEAPFLQQAKVLGVTVLKEADALRIAIRFPDAVPRPERLRRMLALLPTLRDVEGLTMHGAVLRPRGGEIVFATTKTAKPAAIDALRSLVGKDVGLAWAGARGPLAKDLHRVHVTVRDGLVGDLSALENTAAEIAKQVEQVRGIGSALAGIPGTIPVRRLVPAAGTVSNGENEWLGRLLVEDETSAVVIFAPDAYPDGRVHGKPLSAIATLKIEGEPARLRHDDLQRAIDLVWETKDASVIGPIGRLLKGIPNTSVSLD